MSASLADESYLIFIRVNYFSLLTSINQGTTEDKVLLTKNGIFYRSLIIFSLLTSVSQGPMEDNVSYSVPRTFYKRDHSQEPLISLIKSTYDH
jgi:hypothetical protein